MDAYDGYKNGRVAAMSVNFLRFIYLRLNRSKHSEKVNLNVPKRLTAQKSREHFDWNNANWFDVNNLTHFL